MACRFRISMYASSPMDWYWRMAYTSCVGCRYSIHVPLAPGPFPRRSSAPKLSRMKISLPNVAWFRTIQGVTHAWKTADARTIPPTERLCALARRYQVHRPAAGKNDSNDVLLRAVTPQSDPN